jgi:DNA-binding MarR family transcriptional regulator
MAEPRRSPEGETLDAIASLQRVTALFGERRRALARDVGLSETQWQVLEEVNGESFMPSMFARRRASSAASVSRTLRHLLDGDLVRVSIGEEDGRQRVYRTTAKGRRVLDRLAQRRAEAIASIWEPFDRADLRAFTGFATELAERLEGYGESGESA